MARFDKLEFDLPPGDAGSPDATSSVAPPKDQRHWFSMADQHRRRGHYENALRFYSRALEVEKTLVDAWTGQVQMLVLLGEYPQAVMWAQKALELFPNHGDLMAARGQAECRRGNISTAISLSDSALARSGESAYRWQVRGELMLVMKQKTDRHCFDKAQIQSPDHLVPLETGLIYIHHRSYVKAQQRLQTALDRQGDSHYVWYLLARCQTELGLDQAAIRSLEQCLQLCPNHQAAGAQLAQFREGSTRFSSVFKRLIRRNR